MSNRTCENCGWAYPVPEGESDEFVRCCYNPPAVFLHPLRESFLLRMVTAEDADKDKWVKLADRVRVEAWDPRCKKIRPGCHVWLLGAG